MYTVPYAALPLSAGGVPVAGVPMVPNPVHPPGVYPTVAQTPTAPPAGWPGRYPFPQLLPCSGQNGATYSGIAVPAASAQGGTPSAPEPNGSYQNSAASAVTGVTLTPVQHVTPPAAPGGPHPLPTPPRLPVPEGFPNPFDVKQVVVGPPAPAAPMPPGSVTVTGPMGYHPGLGSFAGPSPFWLHLAWQLIQSPQVRQTLEKHLEKLLSDPLRPQTLSLAVACLLEQEIQEAFRSLTTGVQDQARFFDLFARRLKDYLVRAGLITAD